MTSDPKGSFLFITDNTSYQVREPRYLGPYRVADELERQGFRTIVMDRIYSFPDFFGFLESVLDESFLGVGLSTTFLSPQNMLTHMSRYKLRSERSQTYYEYGVISPDPSDRKEWFSRLKKIMTGKSPRARLFVGGSKAQLFTQRLYDDLSEVDYLVMGPVDFVFPEVIKDLANGGIPKFKTMAHKKVIDTMTHYRRPKIDPRHAWRDHWFIQAGEALPIEIGRGCAFNCKFCNYEKRSNLRKSVQDLKEELVSNFERFGVRYYQFVDDCFNDSRKKVEEVCNLIMGLPFKIEWASYLRFDVAVRFPETADLIVAAGGRAFHWGVESLSRDVARRAGKDTPSDRIKDFIVGFSQKYNGICYSTGSFIVGLPGETLESWRDQVDWLLNTENFDFLQIGPLGIAPYDPEFDGSVIDYAEYSRQPEKFGFLEHNPQSGYWRHETMDRTTASHLATEAMELWSNKRQNRRGISTDIWIYPVLRSLGYGVDEVRDLYFNPCQERQQELIVKGRRALEARRSSYYAEMWNYARQNQFNHKLLTVRQTHV